MSVSTVKPLDFDAHYTVAGYGGVAFYLDGWAAAYYDEDGEAVESDRFVRAVMVGDDQEHIVDVDDLTVIDEDDYCHECGQVGCTADGRTRQ
jgi:hypothetical protein